MSAPDPLVSVVIPAYNHAGPLELCLKAIRRQSYPALEVIVVDDCSPDNTAQVAASLGARVVRTPVNSGSAVARNTGAACAAGEVLFFVDADIALAPDAIASAVALLRSDPGIGAVCGIGDPEPLIGDRAKDYRAMQHHYWTADSVGEISFLWSAMFAIRADTFAETGPFNPGLRYTEEVEYGHRLGQRYRLVSTAAVHGRGDCESFRPLMRKIFHRCRLRVPLYARRRSFAQGYETASRAWACLAALLAAATVPLPVLFGLPWLAVPLLLAGAWLAADAAMYRFVYRRRGAAFTIRFTCQHFIANLVIATAVAAGAAQWLVSGRFRRLYEPAAQTRPAVPATEG